ncbi:MAG: LytTR family DNA-binding domain-containing protein [Vicinamibacterales bacterium]
MIRAFILDDERLAVERLTRLLTKSGRVQVVGSQTDPVSALDLLAQTHADVLFLDIQMPGLTGFEFLEKLAVNLPVIFTTAYDEHALRAFATNSIDYLLKPIETERLEQALDKLERLTTAASQPDVRELARALASQLGQSRRHLERLASRVGDRTMLLDVARISHFSAKDKLTFAVVNGREHVIDQTLAQLEEQLDARRFVRIHRATIVNLAAVSELHTADDEGVVVRLKDDGKTQLSVARDRVRVLKERLGI